MQLLEDMSALTHQLADYLECRARIFANERAKLRATDKKRFRVFRCIGIGHVRGFRRDAFHAKRLSGSHDGRHKSATCANSVAQNDVPPQNNRQAISRCSLLIDLE